MCKLISYFILSILPAQFNFIIAQSLKIQYVANEGILLKSQETEILIDATFKKDFDYLDALPVSELNKIRSAKGQYKSIDILLATHLHGDHFNPEITGQHLMSNAQALFIAPEETVTNFKENFEGFQQITSRVMFNTPALFKSETMQIKNIRIKILRLEHLGASPWKEAENVAFLISIGNKKILHLGDSKISIENLEKFKLKEEAINVAILPYWQLGSSQQKEIVERYINPYQIVVAHIPLKDGKSAQASIDSIGYKNATAFFERHTSIVIE